MNQMWLQNLLIALLSKPDELKKLRGLALLTFVNVGLIIFLGLSLIINASHFEVGFISFILMISAGSTVTLLLLKVLTTEIKNRHQTLEAQAYQTSSLASLVFSEEKGFTAFNKVAMEKCWWAKNLITLQKVILDQGSHISLNNLLDSEKTKKNCQEVLKLKAPDGQTIQWWNIISKPLLSGSLWQCRDITSEYESNLKLQKELFSLSTFIENSPYGLVSINDKGIICLCNKSFANWLGYHPEELKGKPFSKVLSRSNRNALHQPSKFAEISGKCDFISATSRVKKGYIEQNIIPSDSQGFFTFSIIYTEGSLYAANGINRILEMTPLAMLYVDENYVIQNSNLLFQDKFWDRTAAPNGFNFLNLIIPSKQEETNKHLQALDKKSNQEPIEIHFDDSRGSIAYAYVSPLESRDNYSGGFFIQFHDITDQKKLEMQLVQSQKMQAIGQLAGGIAHDFNNLLTAMIGFCDLLLQRHTPGDQSFTDIMQIKQNTNRAANLVRQLLAFSRQQTLQPKILDITECLSDLSVLLRRLIGSNIELKFKHSRDLGLVMVDQGQFEQVIINMVVNARDAIDSDGMITIMTSNFELKKSKRQDHDVIPAGSYVLIEIGDTGTGIKAENLDRIFDPFFSTKEVGSGTGLGLSTVYGIVKQTGGFIHVDSKVGIGSKFSIYLPRYFSDEKATIESKKEKKIVTDLTGSSTILLVEDEDAVRLFSARALRSKGYKVLEASNGNEALDLIQTNNEKIDLVITDVVMPQMDGPTFINEIHKIKDDVKVLFISGYAEDTFRRKIKDEDHIKFLAKPFSLNDLASRVKEIIENESIEQSRAMR